MQTASASRIALFQRGVESCESTVVASEPGPRCHGRHVRGGAGSAQSGRRRARTERHLPDVPRRRRRQERRRQVDRSRREDVRRLGARADELQVHRLPQRRFGGQDAARAEAQARQLRGLPRSPGQGVPVDCTREGTGRRQPGRRHLQQLPRQSRHPEVERTDVAHECRPGRVHLRLPATATKR